jgi:hypothetical protein
MELAAAGFVRAAVPRDGRDMEETSSTGSHEVDTAGRLMDRNSAFLRYKKVIQEGQALAQVWPLGPKSWSSCLLMVADILNPLRVCLY